jgi:hypothetical protein
LTIKDTHEDRDIVSISAPQENHIKYTQKDIKPINNRKKDIKPIPEYGDVVGISAAQKNHIVKEGRGGLRLLYPISVYMLMCIS